MDLGALYNPIMYQSHAGTGIPMGGPRAPSPIPTVQVFLYSGVQGIPRWIAEVQWISVNYIVLLSTNHMQVYHVIAIIQVHGRPRARRSL